MYMIARQSLIADSDDPADVRQLRLPLLNVVTNAHGTSASRFGLGVFVRLCEPHPFLDTSVNEQKRYSPPLFSHLLRRASHSLSQLSLLPLAETHSGTGTFIAAIA